ncbi:MAG: hypothetical protein NVS4B3_00260 [Gemmatimonadaceae bacterium]
MKTEHDERRAIASGIGPLDERLGGFSPGKIHLVTGGVGSGKTTACFHFLSHGLRGGERTALLTHTGVADLKRQAASLGMEFRQPLRDGSLLALRYRDEFGRLFGLAASVIEVVDDLAALLRAARPARIAIDPVSPFLVDGSASAAGVCALITCLEQSGATVMVTLSADPRRPMDRGFEPLIERAATILHLTRDADPNGRELRAMTVLRSTPPLMSASLVRFEIRPAVGIAPTSDEPATAEDRRRLRLLSTHDAPPEELLALLRRDYEVIEHGPGTDLADIMKCAALLVDVPERFPAKALALVREFAGRPGMAPVVVVATAPLRSIDQARALRAGAAEVLSAEMAAPEFLQRLAAAVRRPPLARGSGDPTYVEVALSHQVVTKGERRPLDGEELSRALAVHIARDRPVQYTVVSLRPGNGRDAATLRMLADAAMRSMRIAGGDLAALTDERVIVYLHGVRAREAEPYAKRVRATWTELSPVPLDIDFLVYPSDEPKLRTLMELGGRA